MASAKRRPSYDDLVCLLGEVQAELKATGAELAGARAEIAELKRRLALDSTNSSKPSGSDSPFRKPPRRLVGLW